MGAAYAGGSSPRWVRPGVGPASTSLMYSASCLPNIKTIAIYILGMYVQVMGCKELHTSGNGRMGELWVNSICPTTKAD